MSRKPTVFGGPKGIPPGTGKVTEKLEGRLELPRVMQIRVGFIILIFVCLFSLTLALLSEGATRHLLGGQTGSPSSSPCPFYALGTKDPSCTPCPFYVTWAPGGSRALVIWILNLASGSGVGGPEYLVQVPGVLRLGGPRGPWAPGPPGPCGPWEVLGPMRIGTLRESICFSEIRGPCPGHTSL